MKQDRHTKSVFLPSNSQQPNSAVPLLPPPACLDLSTQKEVWGRVWLLKGATASGFLWVVLHSLGEDLLHPTVGKHKTDCQQGSVKYWELSQLKLSHLRVRVGKQSLFTIAYHLIFFMEKPNFIKFPTQHLGERKPSLHVLLWLGTETHSIKIYVQS